MVKKADTVTVELWGQRVGAVSWLEAPGYGVFEFDPVFLNSGLDVAPIHMSLSAARRGDGIFSFPALGKQTFLGLPGLLADALPDKFGNSIIDSWLARQGRDPASFSPVERLAYTGKRGMGAFEFHPATIDKYDKSVAVEIAELVELAQDIVTHRQKLNVELGNSARENSESILDILRVGTSAGGARAKAVIAMDGSGKVMSGQTQAPAGFDYWVIKFDGVTDMELGEPKGYGRIEYAYYLMAHAAGINMTECKLLEENGRAHFMTRRFDRIGGEKLHMQSLCGIAHFDFNMAGAYSYEQAFTVMRTLRLSKADATQQFRRMLFNVVARNQDDHTKNIAFLMGRDGKWKLSPAFDVIYSHNPHGQWTSQHQMSINGCRDNFTRRDLIAVGESLSISKPEEIVESILNNVEKWPEFAAMADIGKTDMEQLGSNHRLKLN